MPTTPIVYTYAATGLPKPIPDAVGNLPPFQPSLTTADIVVPANITIQDIDVGVDITHLYIADLQVTLVGPAGSCILKPGGVLGGGNSVGGAGDNLSGTIFDSEAATAIRAGNAPFTGRFRPEGTLAPFYNTNAAGTWQLRVEDTVPRDTGTLNAVTLYITGIAPVTAQITLGASTLGPGEVTTVVFVLSEAVTTFPPPTVFGGRLSNLSGSGTTYSAVFTPLPNFQGTATILIPINSLTSTGSGQQNSQLFTQGVTVNAQSGPAGQPAPKTGGDKLPLIDPAKTDETKKTAGTPTITPPTGTSTLLRVQAAPNTPCGNGGEWKQNPDGTLFCKEPIGGPPAGPTKPNTPNTPSGPCGRCGEWRTADNGTAYCKEPIRCPGDPAPNTPCGNAGEWKQNPDGTLFCKEPTVGPERVNDPCGRCGEIKQDNNGRLYCKDGTSCPGDPPADTKPGCDGPQNCGATDSGKAKFVSTVPNIKPGCDGPQNCGAASASKSSAANKWPTPTPAPVPPISDAGGRGKYPWRAR